MSCSQMLLGCGLEGWSPAQLTSLAAWYEAGPTYCWQDAGCTVACGDGDPIYTWQDRSGNGYHLTQTDPLKRPTLRLVSGKWCTRFDGVNDFITNTSYSKPGGLSLFTLWSKCRAISSTTYGGFLTWEPNTCGLANTVAPDVKGFMSGPLGVTSTDSTDRGTVNVLRYIGVYDGANLKLYLSGSEVASNSCSGSTAGLSMIRVGNRDSQYANFDFYKMGAVEADVTSDEIARLDQYLQQ